MTTTADNSAAHPPSDHSSDSFDTDHGDDVHATLLDPRPDADGITGLERIAWSMDRDGLNGRDGDIAAVVTLARRSPVSQVLTEVLADENAPAAVRIRAFGKLALQLARR